MGWNQIATHHCQAAVLELLHLHVALGRELSKVNERGLRSSTTATQWLRGPTAAGGNNRNVLIVAGLICTAQPAKKQRRSSEVTKRRW